MVNIPTHPVKPQSSVFGQGPSVWWGTSAVDGDAEPWSSAAVGSLYIYNNAGTAAELYVKAANAVADADWKATVNTG